MDCYIQVQWKVSQPAALKVLSGLGGREVTSVSGQLRNQELERNINVVEM